MKNPHIVNIIFSVAHLALPVIVAMTLSADSNFWGYIYLCISWGLSIVILMPKYEWVKNWWAALNHGVRLSLFSILGGGLLNRFDTVLSILVVIFGPFYDYYVLCNGSFELHDYITWAVDYMALFSAILIWQRYIVED